MLTTRSWPTNQRDKIRSRVLAHRTADRIVQGTGWDGERGCAIGCSLNRYDHAEYARVLGLPLEVAKLIGAIHEGLPPADAVDWPLRVVDALAPNVDTTHVWTRFAIWLLREECPSEVGERVAALYERRLAGDEPITDEWKEAEAEAEAEAATARATWATARAAEAAARATGAAARATEAAVEAAARASWATAAARAAAAARATRVATMVWAGAQAAEAEAEAAARVAYQRQASALVRILAQSK